MTSPPVQAGIDPSALPARSAPIGVRVVPSREAEDDVDCARAALAKVAIVNPAPASTQRSRLFIALAPSPELFLIQTIE